MDEVIQWLKSNQLDEITEVFRCHKINTMNRLKGLTAELIKELTPDIGLRIDLTTSLNRLKSVECEPSTAACKANNFEELTIEIPEGQIIDLNDLYFMNPISGKLEKSVNENLSTFSSVSDNTLDKSATSCSFAATKDLNDSSLGQKKKRRIESEAGPSKHLASFTTTEYIKNLDLKQHLLNHSLPSYNVVEHYEQKGYLTESHRNTLSLIVANILLSSNQNPAAIECVHAAKKICELFPQEKEEVYYCIPDGEHRNAYGKIYHKLKNVKYLERKRGGHIKSRESLNLLKSGSENLTVPEEIEGSDDKSDTLVQAAIAHLKYESHDSWPRILQSWSTTHALRRKIFNETKPHQEESTSQQNQEQYMVNDYFEEWPVLSFPNGYLLLNQDFDQLYPGREAGLITKWDTSAELIIELIRKETAKSDNYSLLQLKEYDKAIKDKCDPSPIILNLLPQLLMNRCRGKKAKDLITIAEIRKTFILHVTIPGDLNRKLENHVRYLKEKSSSFQPTLIFVGPTLSNISACYVQINNVRYQFRSPIKALDTCLKSFFVFDVSYPIECKSVFIFIQKYFFEIHLPEDKKFPRVTTVISSLKGLGSKKKQLQSNNVSMQ